MNEKVELTPDLLLRAYSSGIFPMAESADDTQVHWVEPMRRGIIPLDGFHISRSLARAIRSHRFEPRFNTSFAEVVRECANRPETWINSQIFDGYAALHQTGHAISQEIWQADELVGGVYGVVLGGAFFGESMFSRRDNASKLALTYLIDRLKQTGFVLFDTQFITPHLATLGAIEISRDAYLKELRTALSTGANIFAPISAQSPAAILHRMGQTS